MECGKIRKKLEYGWELRQVGNADDNWLKIEKMPAQVADVLLEYEILPQEVKVGWCGQALWVAEKEWEYRCRFSKPEGKRCRLVFTGLDTLADIYLNGIQIGEHEDFYMPSAIDITEQCREDNELVIRFHSVLKWLERAKLPEHLEGAVLKCKLLRKPIHDFPLTNGPEESSYQGAVPSFTPVGIYGDVYLESWDNLEILSDKISAELSEEKGVVSWEIKGANPGLEHGKAEAFLYLGSALIDQKSIEIVPDHPVFQIKESLEVEDPKLWWPVGFGEHPLYTVEILLKGSHDRTEDRIAKKVGFRKVESPVPLSFLINGKKIRLWGGSMDPMQGYTHCYQPDRAKRIFDMVENANMNTLRIWGEGIPLPDSFYQEADERVILIWQEFFLGHGAYPDDEEFGKKCVEEAKTLVRRLQHHPCILMWCGGNETIMGAEYAGKYPFGDWIVKEAFPEMLKNLEEKRYYHINSPYGGQWANDPREGDSHTYENVWEYPFKDYPNFLSESIRTAPPAKYSLEKIIKGPVWPENYDGRVTGPDQGIMPENWRQRIHPFSDGERYSGKYWEYYDPVDADSMLYAFGASYAGAIMEIGGQVRRGSREPEDFTRRSKGYMACKLLDTWPKVFCALIDYFQEGHMPYYATKRMLEPVMLTFAKEDRIRLFAVNDSPDDFRGTVETGIYNLRTEKFERRELLTVAVSQGDFIEVNDLSKYLFFSKDCILYGRLMDPEGEDVYTCIDYVDVERHLPFGEPELQVEIREDILIIQAAHFARCVEITGSQGEDAFGWLFTDNYFDLMPGTRKKVKILGSHTWGTISVRAQYSNKIYKIEYGRKDYDNEKNISK